MKEPRSKSVEGEKAMFIRSHSDLSAADVVAKATEAGLSFSRELVHAVRSRDKQKAKIAESQDPDGITSGSAFIRSMPIDMPVDEVITKAKEAGFDVATGLIHGVRSAQRKKGKAAAPRMTATEFIRSLPVDMPTSEVLKRGAAAGIKFSQSLVGYTRKADAERAAKGKSGPRKRAPGPPGPHDGAKAAFVRAAPLSLSIAEILEQAKAAGLGMSREYALRMRRTVSSMNGHARHGQATARTPARAKQMPRADEGDASDAGAIALLRSIASSLGLGRAIDILESDLQRVQAILTTHDE